MLPRNNMQASQLKGSKKIIIGILLVALLAVILAVLVLARPSGLSPTVNAKASGAFFVGPVGTQLNASFIDALSNLSAQLQQVGAEQLAGKIIKVNGSPSFYVLLFGNGYSDYDIIPLPVANATPLYANGKPIVVMFSAQGCPFCAGMRWPVAIALSRFGNFTRLYYARSATNDGNAPTFLFNFSMAQFYNSTKQPPVAGGTAPYGDEYPTPISQGAYYSSPYVVFEPFDEVASSFFINASGLEMLNATIYKDVFLQGNMQENGTPYGFGIRGFSLGGVPFIDIGNRYVFDGAIINASTYLSSAGLKKYATHASMLYSIQNPTPDSFGETVLGAANLLTADICLSINNTAQVCKLAYISQLEKKITQI